MILGLGHDVVDLAAFAGQLAEPGTRMRALFSARELRQASARAAAKHDAESTHLAGKWAGKESVLKAWCEALGERPNPYTLDDFPWSGVEILDDSRGRPGVVLHANVHRALAESLAESLGESLAGPPAGLLGGLSGGSSVGPLNEPPSQMPPTAREAPFIWHISLSHDGGVASAVVLLEVRARA
ncbi:holo-ACP synthase [Bifidobacterium avesanii]|uniref:Holo-[acyl-carrier-protein] synthase n=1 Tax=Bifidobacterium avesanii TaxID=1798157 RepID=A0A7K3TG66_9BIFI|nr:4'-phosphopantetheinyl transferase superfamily protein [Bifidobacterium avesanii]KAB8294588.1 4-phosphopantetheinyl transferase [Bifidobacterium avesanii]NEG78097.1 4'-phosphopantetheinyl transferase superfamily protein [Bifidobacterium avesanii]